MKILIFLTLFFFLTNHKLVATSVDADIPKNMENPPKAEMRGTGEGGKGSTILVLADALGTHYNFALNFVNILAENGYKVHFVVVKYFPNDLVKPKSEEVNFVQVQFKNDPEMPKFVQSQTKWGKAVNNVVEIEKNFFKMLKYNMFSFYKAIIEDGRTFEWLQSEKFDLGIAEFCISSGAFALFHRIGLHKYIATTAAPPFPVTQYFLGQKIVADVPERFTAKLGDGNNSSRIRNRGTKRRIKNIAEYRRSIPKYIKLYNKEYIGQYGMVMKRADDGGGGGDMPPPFGELIRKARYFLINQHPIARFPVKTADRVEYIGGIDVEAVGKIGQKFANEPAHQGGHLGDYEWIKKEDCVVVFSLGTMIQFAGFTREYTVHMYNAMANHKECKFLVRIDEKIGEHIQELQKGVKAENRNIITVSSKGRIPQQEILALKNVRAFIHHCGQNTLNEVLYAGIPSICIPFFGDQFYNAAIAEYMGVGIWVEHQKFERKFPEALDKLLGGTKNGGKNKKGAKKNGAGTKSDNPFQKVAANLASAIHNHPQKQITKLLSIIEKAINEENVDDTEMASPFPSVNLEPEPGQELVKVEVDETVKIPKFNGILEQFQKGAIAAN